MITIRRAEERGHFDHGWLDTWHTFSFADYYDPENMGFRALRVINDDRVAPGRGFGTHGHRDMEIITVVLEGELEHRDSMGNGSIIRPGEVQRMSAGTGVTHSEKNPSPVQPLHLMQIWILPERRGITPSYEQKYFSDDDRRGRFRLIASRDGAEDSVTIHQDASVYASVLRDGDVATHTFAPGRHGWLHVSRGAATVNGEELRAGDAVAVSDEASITVTGDGDLLLFDLN